MNVLSSLDKLGFPMYHIGTYFYKDIIMTIKPRLKEIVDEQSREKHIALKLDLSVQNSRFLNKIANDNYMRNYDFLALIEDSIKAIDVKNIDMKLYNKIFDNLNLDKTCGELAIKIALYSFEKQNFKR